MMTEGSIAKSVPLCSAWEITLENCRDSVYFSGTTCCSTTDAECLSREVLTSVKYRSPAKA